MPPGKHITTIYGDRGTLFQVVGVAKNSRDHSLRDGVPPRFFAALDQNAMSAIAFAPSFEIRTHGEANAVLTSTRRAIAEVEGNVEILNGLLFSNSVD